MVYLIGFIVIGGILFFAFANEEGLSNTQKFQRLALILLGLLVVLGIIIFFASLK